MLINLKLNKKNRNQNMCYITRDKVLRNPVDA